MRESFDPDPELGPFSEGGRESAERAPVEWEEEKRTVEPTRPGEAIMMGEEGAVEPGPREKEGAALVPVPPLGPGPARPVPLPSLPPFSPSSEMVSGKVRVVVLIVPRYYGRLEVGWENGKMGRIDKYLGKQMYVCSEYQYQYSRYLKISEWDGTRHIG